MTTWVWPETLDEALAERARLGDGALVVGGGVWATLLVGQGLVKPDTLLALGRVAGLADIGAVGGELRLGAMARISDVAGQPLVRELAPALAECYEGLANERVRNQGTIGGNLCEADYGSDPATMLVALGAEVVLVGRGGKRRLPVADFVLGHYQTALRDDELMAEVRVPAAPPESRSGYLRFVSRSSEDRPCAGIAVSIAWDQHVDVVEHLRIVVGAVADRPVALDEVCGQYIGRSWSEERASELAHAYARAIEPVSDLRGSAEYRRRVVRALIPRAIRTAVIQSEAKDLPVARQEDSSLRSE